MDAQQSDLLNDIAKKLDAHILSSASSRREMRRDVKCLHDGFVEFRDKYSSMLDQSLNRKKWWENIIEEQKKRSALWMTGIGSIAILYGLGHAFVYLWKKIAAFIGIAA